MKKTFQIIWVILAVIFLGILFLKVWSDSIVTHIHSTRAMSSACYQINKITGKVKVVFYDGEFSNYNEFKW